jgi:Tol biopolymer transport system component
MKAWLFLIPICLLPGVASQVPAPDNLREPVKGIPRMVDASLLVGTPPLYLLVTNPREDILLQTENSQPEFNDGTPIFPSFSKDGKVIAFARVTAGFPYRTVAITTYSAVTDKHTDYSAGEYSGSVAISPDATKLAYSATQQREGGPGDNHLHIVDLISGQQTLGPEVPFHAPVFASWSPDSRRLVYEFLHEIRVWDRETGKIAKIADGYLPAWSPSGDWIAFLQSSEADTGGPYGPGEGPPRCVIVRPNGADERMLIDFYRVKKHPGPFVAAPVWSPDSKIILLNEREAVEAGTVTIHALDIETMKMKTIFKHALPVLGWASAAAPVVPEPQPAAAK